jgi:urease accessory protein
MTVRLSSARRSSLLCDSVIGNVSALAASLLAGKAADPLPLTWFDCTRRAFRKTTAGGREVAVLMPVGVTLSHGDLLHVGGHFHIVVEVQPCDLWHVTAADPATLARVAVELGNLHVPVQVTEVGDLLTPPDGPAEGALRRNGLSYALCRKRFSPLRATVTSALSVARSMKVTLS